MQLRFHMICVPGTARITALAALSFVRHSSYQVSIVANGLGSEETEFLEHVVASSEQLDLHPYRTATLVKHWQMLNRLSEQETSDWFCFMDSDIFTIAPFSQRLEAILETCDIFSSCYPLASGSNSLTRGYTYLALESPAGKQLATSFFCAYRMDVLRRIRDECDIGFETISNDDIPKQCLPWIANEDLQTSDDLDTGKLLTLLSHSFGFKTQYVDLHEMVHVGGISSRRWEQKWKWKLGNYLRRRFVLTDHDLSPDDRSLHLYNSSIRKLRSATDDRTRDRYLNKMLRHRVASFFAAYVDWKYGDGPQPEMRLNDHELRNRAEAVCRTFEEINQENQGLLGKHARAA